MPSPFLVSSRRRLTRNSLFLLAGYGAGRITAFLVTVLLARRLGLEEFAVVILAQSIALYVSMFLDFGLVIAGIRAIANDHASLRGVMGSVLGFRLSLAGLIVIAIGTAFQVGWLGPTAVGIVIAGFALAAIIASVDVAWAAQGLGRTGPRAVVLTTAAVVQLAVTFLLLSAGLGIYAAVGGMLAGAVVSIAIGAVITLPSTRPPVWPGQVAARTLARAAIPLGLGSFLTLVYYSFDILLMAATRPSPEVAIYGAIYKILTVFLTISWVVSLASLPDLTAAHATGRDSLRASIVSNVRLLLTLLVPLIILVVVEAPWIVTLLFGPSFLPGVEPLRILMTSVVLAVISATVLYGLTASGRPSATMVAAGCGAIVNVTFDLITVPANGMAAAAAGTVVAELAVVLVAVYLGRSLVMLPMALWVGRVVVAAIPACVIGILVEPNSPVLAAGSAIAVYCSLALLLGLWKPISGLRQLATSRVRDDHEGMHGD